MIHTILPGFSHWANQVFINALIQVFLLLPCLTMSIIILLCTIHVKCQPFNGFDIVKTSLMTYLYIWLLTEQIHCSRV